MNVPGTRRDAAAADPSGVRIDVLRGMPGDDELAALLAVVTEAYTCETENAVVDDSPRRSEWALSQRALRSPLRRDIGWRRWGG